MTGPRALAAVRAAWAVTLGTGSARLIQAAGNPPHPAAVAVARLLAARQLLQAGAGWIWPTRQFSAAARSWTRCTRLPG